MGTQGVTRDPVHLEFKFGSPSACLRNIELQSGLATRPREDNTGSHFYGAVIQVNHGSCTSNGGDGCSVVIKLRDKTVEARCATHEFCTGHTRTAQPH